MGWHLQRLVVRSVKSARDKSVVLTFRCPDGENSHQQCGDKLLDQERIDPRVHKRDRAAAVVSGLHDARQGLREELTRTMRKERGRCGPGRVVAVADEECLCLAKAVPRSYRHSHGHTNAANACESSASAFRIALRWRGYKEVDTEGSETKF